MAALKKAMDETGERLIPERHVSLLWELVKPALTDARIETLRPLLKLGSTNLKELKSYGVCAEERAVSRK